MKNQATVTLRLITDVNGDGQVNYGDTIAFDITTDEPWDQVQVTCSQGDKVVYSSVWWKGYTRPMEFFLKSDVWDAAGGGPATGVAVVEQFRRAGQGFKRETLAEHAFDVV